MSARLAGKVALITGGASGIGAAHVRLFAANGAKVLSCDIQDDQGATVVAEATRLGAEAAYFHLDVTSEVRWIAAVQQALSRFGRLTTLCNVAGIYRQPGVEAETIEGWNRLVAINQTGVWLGMRAVAPAMRQAGGGAIVNISSLYGLIGSHDSIAYHASKGAVRILSKAAAASWAGEGIRVNSIYPGQIDTPILSDLTQEHKQQIAAAIPMGRMGRPEDIAYASLYLCSEEAAYVTGAELVIDGGWSTT